MKRFVAVLIVVLLGYLLTGLFFVRPDEEAVVRRFGAALDSPRGPGPHYGLPRGLDRIDRLKTRQVKRVAIGSTEAGRAVGTQPLQLLTRDRNLIDIRATIQYTIRDPAQYLFAAVDVDAMVRRAGESVLTQVVARHDIDQALTLSKSAMAQSARDKLQVLVDDYELGIAISSFEIRSAAPPPEVAEAFADVIRALRQRDQQINQAQAYAHQSLAEAKSEADQVVNASRSLRDRAVRGAEGEAERFERLLSHYLQEPELIARRLYLETMAETLPKFRSKLIVDSDSDIDLSILPGKDR